MARIYQFPPSTAANPWGVDLSMFFYWEEDVREHDESEVPLLAEVLLGHAEGKKRKRDDEPEEQLNFPATGEASSSRPKRARRAPEREPEAQPNIPPRPKRARRAPKHYEEEPPAKKPKKAATTKRAPSAAPAALASSRAASQASAGPGAPPSSRAASKPRAASRAASRAPSTTPAPVAGPSAAPLAAPTTAGLVPNARGKMVDLVKSARAKANWAKRKAKGVEHGDAATKAEE